MATPPPLASTTPTPMLDFRDEQQFYRQAIELAHAYTPAWAGPTDDSDTEQDPGLVLLKLFAHLAHYTAGVENRIPAQRRLGFFQFMNMQLRPPVPARAPLCFALKAGQGQQAVPRGTAVLNGANQAVRFQTSEDLVAVPATLSAALTVISAQDQFVDALALFDTSGGEGAPIFVANQIPDPNEQALSHWFMLGDPTLFKPDSALQRLTVSLVGKHLHPEYFGQWCNGALLPLSATSTHPVPDRRSLKIVLTRPSQAGALTIATLQQALYADGGLGAGCDAVPAATQDTEPQYWLLVKPGPQVKVLASLKGQLPEISSLHCTFDADGIQPQQAACNLISLDLGNGAYPFGETPKKNDAFYLRSDSVFAKTGARVTVTFELGHVARVYPVTLAWQFWDGKQWSSFNDCAANAATYQFEDSTDKLRNDQAEGHSAISFQCPQMAQTTVAGAKGLWIRSVIAAGGYGRTQGVTAIDSGRTISAIPGDILTDRQKREVIDYLNGIAGVNFSYKITNAEYDPPFIQSAQLSYSYSAKPASLWSYNAFALSPVLSSPFVPMDETLTAFYFAFAPKEFGSMTVGKKLALYIYLQQETATSQAHLQWQYHDGNKWRSLAVDDGTHGLCHSAVVTFLVPAAMETAQLFSQTAYWFRILNGQVGGTVRVRGIYPNTVMASNITSVDGEVLGSGNGVPNQTFLLNHTPVLPNLQLCVIEAKEEAGADDAKVAAVGGAVPGLKLGADEVLQQWSMVDAFTFSGPADRVYSLDYQSGLLSFGDGKRGKIPPAGHNNVVAVHYEYTQGLAGNGGAGELNLLRPGIVNIVGVTNPAPATGGVNGDTVATLARTSPALIRAGGWAVQLQDLAALAAAASQQVAQARAVETPDGFIRIALLSMATDPRPHTSAAVLEQVAAHVKQYCLAALVSRIGTVAPDFVPVAVKAQLKVQVDASRLNTLRDSIGGLLEGYFQPVFGGSQLQGWSFGETVQASEVSVFLRSIPQVIAVLELSLNGLYNGDVMLSPIQLPVAGIMQLTLEQG